MTVADKIRLYETIKRHVFQHESRQRVFSFRVFRAEYPAQKFGREFFYRKKIGGNETLHRKDSAVIFKRVHGGFCKTFRGLTFKFYKQRAFPFRNLQQFFKFGYSFVFGAF